MKIHGTAKGGAISKKDFGVAFGGGAGFTPNSISDLWAWWRGSVSDDMTLSGSSITVWNPEDGDTDKQLIADTTSVAPTFDADAQNDNGAAQFDGTEWIHTNDDSNELTQPFTFAIAAKFPSGASKTIFDVDNTGGGRIMMRATATTGKYELKNGATNDSSTVPAISDEWGYMIVVCDGSDSLWRINGSNEATFTLNDNFRPITIGADYGGNNDATMECMHFIIYNAALSSDSIGELEEYLADQVGL